MAFPDSLTIMGYRPRRCLLLFACWLTGLALAGCGQSQHPGRTISGTVTFDGEPLPDGLIILEAEKSALAAQVAPIKDGKYSFFARLGFHGVQFRAFRPGKDKDGQPILEQYVPPIYTRSTLLMDIKVEGDGFFDFALLSQAPP